jgi:hypothetical protein
MQHEQDQCSYKKIRNQMEVKFLDYDQGTKRTANTWVSAIEKIPELV